MIIVPKLTVNLALDNEIQLHVQTSRLDTIQHVDRYKRCQIILQVIPHFDNIWCLFFRNKKM